MSRRFKPLRGFHFHTCRAAAQGGFSLIEVVLAIGVLAFAIVPMVWLLPHGQQALHIAIRQNAEARIQQGIIGRLSTEDWSTTNNLADFNNSSWYFDDQGTPVTTADQALYTVQLQVSNPLLPGANVANTYLATILMKVTDLPASLQPFTDPNRYRAYVTTVARMDKVPPAS